jgi:hypothetical protein
VQPERAHGVIFVHKIPKCTGRPGGLCASGQPVSENAPARAVKGACLLAACCRAPDPGIYGCSPIALRHQIAIDCQLMRMLGNLAGRRTDVPRACFFKTCTLTGPRRVVALLTSTERFVYCLCLSGRKKARISSTSACGCSRAAKCPPAGISLQRWIL